MKIFEVTSQVSDSTDQSDPSLWQRTKNLATGAADTVKGAASEFQKDPVGSFDATGRALSNAMTFGQADKLVAKAQSLINNTDYENELTSQYKQGLAARKAYPNVSQTADVTGTVFNPGFGAGAKIASKVAPAVIAKVAPSVAKAFNTVPGQTAKNVAKKLVTVPAKIATDVAGGTAGYETGKEIAKKVSPSPYLDIDESARIKELVNYGK